MEVIEDGNILDRIPILLQRDFEYYEKNQTVLSESVCRGVVGGRLDFPRNASFAAVKVVRWLEDEFTIAFQHGSGMFVNTEEEKPEGGVVKTSDPDKFVQLTVKASDALLEHLHVLVQEALDHADLPVLTATLGAAALLKNSLYCYLQHVEDLGHSERLSNLQACYKRVVTMSEAVGERVLDLHSRVLSLYILQEASGRPVDDVSTHHTAGTPATHGWWLYLHGSRKDLWDTVPPRMAQRIFAGMVSETLTILTVRYCQTITTETTTPVLLNDVLNTLLCIAQLLPSIASTGAELCGAESGRQARDVRDVHAKCNELFKCLVFRGADLHYIHQAVVDESPLPVAGSGPAPWFVFVSPSLFDDVTTPSACHTLHSNTAIGLELTVLLAQPQPEWTTLVKVLMMRDCQLSRSLFSTALRNSLPGRWAGHGRWYSQNHQPAQCGGFLCTRDGFCQYTSDGDEEEEYARLSGALTFVLASIGSKHELHSTLCLGLEISGKPWAACLDKRQVWCDRRPAWLAALLALIGDSLRFMPPMLVQAVQGGASMYQTMSLFLSLLSRCLECLPAALLSAARLLQRTLPPDVAPVGGSVLLTLLAIRAYEEICLYAHAQAQEERANAAEANGQPRNMQSDHKPKHVRMFARDQTVSIDAGGYSVWCIALAVGEALCSIDDDHKHTQEIEQLVNNATSTHTRTDRYGLEDFPDFAEFFEQGSAPTSNADRASDAAALTSHILMTAAGRDSLRVIYEHLQQHSEPIFKELGLSAGSDGVPRNKAPLLYTMFHIGDRPFDQYLRGEWPLRWSQLVRQAVAAGGVRGARGHVTRRPDVRASKHHGATSGAPLVNDLLNVLNARSDAT